LPREPDRYDKSTTFSFDELPDSALVRLPLILGDKGSIPPLLPISRATWWRMVKTGKAPAPVKVSVGVTAWRVGEIRAMLAGHLQTDGA
jgi:predicted DNA-binding transcriptional regulator AlpA